MPRIQRNTPLARAFDNWVRRGVGELSVEEHRVMRDALDAASHEARALSTVTGMAGGYLVPNESTDQIDIGLQRFSSVAEVATIEATETGGRLPWPTVNDTVNAASQTPENAQATSTTDPTFGNLFFGAFQYQSGIVLVPIALLEDSAVDIETLLLMLCLNPPNNSRP
jgi:HK97 family phage major capsid protein